MTSRTSGLAAGLYFISLVILGSYYVLNLFLAVMVSREYAVCSL